MGNEGTQTPKGPLRLGIIPILAIAAVALVGGYLLGDANGESNESTEQPLSSTVGQQPSQQTQGTPQSRAVPPDTTDLPDDPNERAAIGLDAGAKSAVITAAEAMETCATDNSGKYAACDLDKLVQTEPTLARYKENLTTDSTATSYAITMTSASGNRFTLARGRNGSTTRTCQQSGSKGCMPDGRW